MIPAEIDSLSQRESFCIFHTHFWTWNSFSLHTSLASLCCTHSPFKICLKLWSGISLMIYSISFHLLVCVPLLVSWVFIWCSFLNKCSSYSLHKPFFEAVWLQLISKRNKKWLFLFIRRLQYFFLNDLKTYLKNQTDFLLILLIKYINILKIIYKWDSFFLDPQSKNINYFFFIIKNNKQLPQRLCIY